MIRSILVIRLGSLGDVILTSSTVLNLKLAHPSARITYLTKDRFADLARVIPGVDEVRTLPDKTSAVRLYQLILTLDNQRFDLIVDLHGNMRSWIIRTLVAAPTKVNYPKRRFERWLIVNRKQLPTSWPHTIDIYNHAVSVLGYATPSGRPVFRAHLAPTRDNTVIIAPGAAHPNKQWSMERFAGVAQALQHELGVKIISVVTGADAGKILLSRSPRGSFFELVDEPLSVVSEAMASARLTIANDSGLAHLSSAVGTPVLAVFGPTHPSLGFSPRGLFDEIIQVNEYCRPCSLHGKKRCSRSEQFCFTRIGIRDVVDAAQRILARKLNTHRALLLDRDGTVIEDRNYGSDPDQIQLIPGAGSALRKAQESGFKLVTVSNQSGVARGYFGTDAVEATNNRVRTLLAAQGVHLDLMLFCPHHREGSVPEYSVDCSCRKPSPGMAERVAKELNVDLRRSFVIGDKVDDMALGMIAGCTPFLVRTGYGKQSEEMLRSSSLFRRIEVDDDLAGAIEDILGQRAR